MRVAAMIADVIKTYVRLGIGLGIELEMPDSDGPSEALTALPGSNRFFEPSATKIATLKLRRYACRLMEMLAPHMGAGMLSGAKRRPAADLATPLLRFAARADPQGARPGA